MSALPASLPQLTAFITDDKITQVLGTTQTVLQYAGTVAFAISGALVAGRKHMDVVGVVVLGTIVAVGGGTLRDVLVGSFPVFWVDDPTFVIVAALAALATMPLAKTGALVVVHRYHAIELTDAAGMAIFVVTGTNVALGAGAGTIAAALVGVLSGIGGGIIRDMMANEIPSVLTNGQFYATAALAGSLLYVGLLELSWSPLFTTWIAVLAIFSLRALSLIFDWGVPSFKLQKSEDPERADVDPDDT